MKLKKILSLLLVLGLLFSVLCGCDTEKNPDDSKGNDNLGDDDAVAVYPIGNVRQNIADYTVVRPDNCDDLKEPSILILTVAKEKTGSEPDITTDYEPVSDANAPEILVGETSRAESAEAMAMLTEKMPYLITQIDNKICIVANTVKGVAEGVNEFLGIYFNYDVPEFLHHNVRDYGAVGDGKEDDTKAFKDAVKAAEADGLPVYVPAGEYLITSTIKLNSVTLYGYDSGAWTADSTDLPTVCHTDLESPLFDVVGGSLSGLNLKVVGAGNADENGIEAVETVRLRDPGSRVSNLRIHNPYIGISTYYDPALKGNPGRCFIENIFIIQAWNTGVFVHGTYDVATLCNIEVWNSGSTACPVAFRFGKNDDVRCVNLFAFNAKIGFYFEETVCDTDGGKGGCWGSFTNCSVDYSHHGVVVGPGQHSLTFVGGTYWAHFTGLKVESSTSKNTMLTFTGCEIKTNGASTITISGGQMVAINGCNLVRIMSGYSHAPINISGGTGVTISGNTIATLDTAVNIESGFKGGVAISGNVVLSAARSDSNAIKNAAKNATVTSTGNVILTGQEFD